MPKQFHDLLGQGKTLLQATAARFEALVPHDHIWVVTQERYADITKQQLPWISQQQILCEPTSRNTGPCIAYACRTISQIDPTATLIITPSDHHIQQEGNFITTLQQALDFEASSLGIILLGAPCTRPETGYGYIAYESAYQGLIKPVLHFLEKPARERAQQLIEQGNYVWNTGIFMGKVNAFIQNFQTYWPDLWIAFEQVRIGKASTPSSLVSLYQTLPNESFDKGVLEKAKHVFVMRADFGWTDLGTWDAVYDHLHKDREGNACQGQVVTLATTNCLIQGDGQQLIATYGLDNLVIVQHNGMLLVCPKDKIQHLKELVQKLPSDS
jgi:mannose-1-phosphate guanylyltransferase